MHIRLTTPQHLINEAALVVYGRWRALGLSHDDAIKRATRFARRAVRCATRSDRRHIARHQPYPVRAAVAVIVTDAMASA